MKMVAAVLLLSSARIWGPVGLGGRGGGLKRSWSGLRTSSIDALGPAGCSDSRSASRLFLFLALSTLRVERGRKRSRAGHLMSLQWCPGLRQLRHLGLQSQMPATACFHAQCWSCLSELCVPPQIWHFTESLLKGQALEVLMWPKVWQREH